MYSVINVLKCGVYTLLDLLRDRGHLFVSRRRWGNVDVDNGFQVLPGIA